MPKGLFENMRDELRNLSKEMAAIEAFKENVKDVEEVIENINSPLTIMVMGEFSTGKSTFINALMGEAITKVDAKPTTAVITKLVYGERDRIVVHYQDGSAKEYGRTEFERLTAEADAQSNELHERMDYVERTLPIDMLKSMSIIDSPGLNSIKYVHEDMTRHFMDKADTVLWMFDANKPGSQTEIDALKRLNPRLTPLVLVNKIDGIDEEEGDSVEGILEGVERRLENNKIEAQGYLGISAKMAFKGKTENRDKLVQASNIGAFYDAIEEKVLPGREQYKRNSLLDGLVKMIYGVGSHIKELREKNEERKGSDYAAYVAMETELATVWDELENIADIMLTDIENNQSQGRKRLNAAMKAFYGMIHWLGIFVEQDDEVARKYLEEAAVRGDEAAQRVLVDWLWSKGEEEAAKYWGERIGIEDLPIKNREDVFHEKTKGNIIEDVEKGEGINKDECEAYNWHVKTMESESNEVENKIGEENGFMKMESNENSKVEKEPKEKNYKRLLSDAASGDVRAMEALGDLYCNDGEYLNFGMAIKWYKNAVKSGGERYDDGYLAGKMYLFGEKLECGDGVKKDLNEAVKWYKKAVENGLKDADFKIHAIEETIKKDGLCEAYNWHVKTMESESNEVENKIGEENGFMKMESNENSKVEKEPKEKNYKRLLSDAASGDVRAMEALGDLYCNDGEHLNFGMAIKWYKNAVKSGGERYDDGYLAGKMYLIGKKLECGDGVKKDLNEAVKWYKRAVENGLKDADFKMHAIEEMIKKDGFTVEKIIIKGSALYEKGRYAEALNCFKVAAKDGKSDAMTWMGKMYAEGKGVDQDYGEAMHWYIKAANMGNPDAMNNMGDMYNEGKGVGKDYNCARGWYQKAINAGSDKAKKNLDCLKEKIRKNNAVTKYSAFEKGLKFYAEKKYEEALSCFIEGASKGDLGAMVWVGRMIEAGEGVSQDYSEAMQWYMKAADMGNAAAMNHIGIMYHRGKGVEVDYDWASSWYQKAINGGYDTAKENLDILKGERRRYNQEARKEKSSGCFITTATCDNFGKLDDCYELNAFRNFRDNWLSCQPDGPALIAEYYDVAPAIVRKIDSLANAKEIYVEIWNRYLSKCLMSIEQGDNMQCKKIYVDMVHDLQKKVM